MPQTPFPKAPTLAQAATAAAPGAAPLASAGLLDGGLTSPVGGADAPRLGSPPLGVPPDRAAVVAGYPGPRQLDLSATEQAATRAAAARLRAVLRRLTLDARIALGHQDTTAYGVGWAGDDDRSDVKSVCGSHAAVQGWDLFRIEHGAPLNGDGVPFELMRRRIEAGYRAGGITTLSWHVDNPMSGGDAWDTTRAVASILPGGAQHDVFRVYLDRAAEFLQSLRGPEGELIPVVFRPFHEHNGAWFWWGAPHATDVEYTALWRFTVDHLRRQRGLTHLLFAFSPGGSGVREERDYLFRYPGDDCVDVFGLDHYCTADTEDATQLVHALEVMVGAAERRGKVAALTEFGFLPGLAALPSPDWFTRWFFEPIQASPTASRIAYALAWRNADAEHAFLPYPGHEAASDLRRLGDDPRLLLERDLTPLLRAVAVSSSPVTSPPPTERSEPKVVPARRTTDYPWMSVEEWERRRQALLALPLAARRAAELVFVGDSITEGWDEALFTARYAPYGALRLGIGGDTTANVLYRIEHGELAHLAPRVVVLLIGTNDLGNDHATPEAAAAGVRAVVASLRGHLPAAQLVLLAVLPREQQPEADGRRAVEELNRLLAPLAAEPHVHHLDLRDALLEPDGTIAPGVMADFLHPTPEGYRRMADALGPTLDALLAR